MSDISIAEAANQLSSQIEKEDTLLENLIWKAKGIVEELDDESISFQKKYEKVMSIEFVLFKIRFNAEASSIQIKRIMKAGNVPVSLQSIFVKQDTFIQTILQKLNNLRDELTLVQKLMYLQNYNFNK